MSKTGKVFGKATKQAVENFRKIKINIAAGCAAPGPPLGPILGEVGILSCYGVKGKLVDIFTIPLWMNRFCILF